MGAVAATKVIWRDAPLGRCWACTACKHATLSGERAAEHMAETNHGMPGLSFADEHVLANAPAPKTTVLAVRAGDYVQAGDDLRLALEIAATAISLAQKHGAPADTTNRLQALIRTLRAS